MAELIAFPKKYRFGIDILKYENEVTGEVEQKIIICLRQEDCKYPIVNPVTSLLKCWASNSYKTQYDYANRVVSLLNYLYFDTQKIDRFDEIKTEMIIDYLNYLTGTGKSRSYVVESRRILTKFFYYATYHYTDICDIDNAEFVVNVKNRKSVLAWPELDVNVLLPTAKTNQRKKVNKLTNLDVDLILRFIELAMVESPNCALGFYFMFFGGLRGSEACHLTGDDIPKRIGNNFFYVHVEDKILNPEDKYADLNQSKKNRRQMILVVPELYKELVQQWKVLYGEGPIVRNHSGNAMGIRGLAYNFNKVKKVLISRLDEGDSKQKMLAYTLTQFSWNTHIGRGFFSNLIANNTQNPYLISVARGDSDFSSALPYIAESEQTMEDISNLLERMYKNLQKDNI